MSGAGHDSAQALLSLLAGKWVTSAISAAAELGVADALVAAPLSAGVLAERLQCDPSALARLLGVLVGEGFLELDASLRYALTALGRELCADRMRDLARFVGAPFMWTPWAGLADAVRSDGRGASAFEATHGAPLFAHLDTHAADAALYHRAVDTFTRREARALAEAVDFSDIHTLVDVGGGLGSLLVEVLARHAHVRGVLVDRESVVEQARLALESAPERARIAFSASDFFASVPRGGDAYVLKHVLHNWDDERCVRLLELCARGLNPGGKLLLVEGFLLPGNVRDATRLLDLEMFVLCGAGRERTKPEMRALLHRAGLRLVSSQPLAGTTRLTVCVPRV